MVYRRLEVAPRSALPPERRGRVLGRFCHGCGAVYSEFARRHEGKPILGRDHVASPCSHEGEPFDPGEPWWEPAVEAVLAPAGTGSV